MVVDGEEENRTRQSFGGRMESGTGMLSSSSSRICQLLMIHMTGGAPYGFRIAATQGNGLSPFVVSMIRQNGKAYRSGLQESDLVLAINGFSCYSCITHQSATKLMEYDDPELTLHILRGDNVCEEDICAALQSLDSQILVLTDEEVQSTIAKKQPDHSLNVSKSPYISSSSQRIASPFRLQLPSQAPRGKQADKRQDKEHDGSNDEKGTTQLPEIPDSRHNPTRCFLPETNLHNSNHGLTVLEYQQNEKVAKNHPNERQDQVSREVANEASNLVTNASHNKFVDPTSSSIYEVRPNEIQRMRQVHVSEIKETNTVDSRISSGRNVDKQNIVVQNVTSNPVNNSRSRYRVEQTIEFKPLQQSRYYDADSGQFRENIPVIPQKRRSNSISSCHMYIGSAGLQSSASTGGANGSMRFQHGSNQMPMTSFNQNAYNATASPSSFESMKQISHHQTLSRSGLVHEKNDVPSNTMFSPELENASSQGFSSLDKNERITSSGSTTIRQSTYTRQRSSNTSSNSEAPRDFHVQSPTTSSAAMRSATTRSLSLRQPEVYDTSSTKYSQFSPVSDTPSRSHYNYLRPDADRVEGSRLIGVRPSSERVPPEDLDANASFFKHLGHHRSATGDRFSQSSEYGRERIESGTSFRGRPSSSTLPRRTRQLAPDRIGGSTFDYNQTMVNNRSCISPATVVNSQKPITYDSIALDEGKGGRLFARRRANSDAWIVGERSAPGPSLTTSERTTTNIRGYGPSETLPRRRLSLLSTNQRQRPVDTTQSMGRDYRLSNNVLTSPSSTQSFNNSRQLFGTADSSQSLDYSSASTDQHRHHQSFRSPTMTRGPMSPGLWSPTNATRQQSDLRAREEASFKACYQEHKNLTSQQDIFKQNPGYTDL